MASAEGSRAAQPEKPAPASQVEAGKAAPEPVAGGLSLLTAVAGAVLLTVLIASLDETYESVQEHDGLARVDQPLLDWMVGHRSPGLDGVVSFFTDIGGTTVLPILVTLVVAGLAWWWRSWTPIVLMAVAAAGSIAMTEAGKDLAGRARPPQALAVPPVRDESVVPERAHAELDGHRDRPRLPGPAPCEEPDGTRRHRVAARPLRGGHGAEPGLPRAPLVHRRRRGVHRGDGLGDRRDPRPPAAAARPTAAGAALQDRFGARSRPGLV